VDLLPAVELHLLETLGPDDGRASVTFLGMPRIEVLRFGTRYVTLGMCATPMSDPSDLDATSGPRAELALSLAERHDDVVRTLCTVAAAPAVEGMVLRAGSTVDLQEPLWSGSRFTAVVVGAAGGLVPDLEDVQFFPLLPMTPSEAAFARVKGSTELEARWLDQGLDLRDASRREADLS
jgi:hypothetical protein